MTCATCTNWNPRNSGGMAAQRMAVCNLGAKWEYKPAHGRCNSFKQAPADVVEARVKWLGRAA